MSAQLNQEARQDRAIRLFSYLKEITELRSKAVRDYSQYDRILWLGDLPAHPTINSVFDEGEIHAASPEAWLVIRKPGTLTEPPACPPSLERWITPVDIHNSSLDTLRLREYIPLATKSETEEGGSVDDHVEFSEDHPELQEALDRYLALQWEPWAEQNRIDRKIKSAYEALFAMYQTQQRAGEQFEIVLGLGLLTWAPPEGVAVQRHLTVVSASVAFDTLSGSISLVPGPDGTEVFLEQDMLEPEFRPDPREEQRVRTLLEAASDLIYDRALVGAALTAWVNAVSADGRYLEEMLPGAKGSRTPVVRFAPALLVRKRTDRSLLRFLTEAIEQLETNGVVPEGILDLIETSDEALFADEFESEGMSSDRSDQTLYFPLEANEEQIDIVKRLEQRHGVLVQGPPGTGKSHTIANLISHLLAMGQRVLVTSHTPRALRVLRDKIPEDIQSLCVSLVGADRTAIEEVESSVLGITQRFDQYNRGRQRQTIVDIEHRLDKQRKANASLAREVRALRERETYRHVLGIGGYEGTAQRIAERLSVDNERLGWIPDSVPIDREAPLTLREAESLVRILRDLTPGRIEYLETLHISSEDLPYPEEFDEFVAREQRAKRASDSYNDFRVLPQYQRIALYDAIQRAEIKTNITLLRNRFAALRNQDGHVIARFFEALRAGEFRQLRVLNAQSSDALSRLESAAPVAMATIVGLDHLDRSVVARDATALISHLRGGGGKGIPGRRPQVVKETEYLTRSVFVDGVPCRDEVTLDRLLARLSADQILEEICRRWEPFEVIASSSMSRRIDELRELKSALEHVMFISEGIDALFRDTGIIPASESVSWETDRQLAEGNRLLDAVEAQEHSGQATAAFATAMSGITSRLEKHPLQIEFQSAVEARSPDRYRICFEQLVQCDEDRLRLDLRDQLSDRLRVDAPKLLDLLTSTSDDPEWDSRMAVFLHAWDHARGTTWLEEFEQPGRLAQLLKQVDAGHMTERGLVRTLSAELAWLHFFDRMTQSQSQHLRAWALAVRKIGKGTGKYAAAHRQNAREHMEFCRPAIPAWIMPIYRVTETLRPNIDTFDVVIVDEASQSGSEALFLQYIAKKIVIVGDDKQISPTSFADQGSVDLLRRRNIWDLPHSETLGVNNSFFDQAVIRYSGRVQLREHFRCMPEIIQFSNNLSYANSPLIPLRQYGVDRLDPVVTTHVANGYEPDSSGTQDTNPPEAEAIVRQIVACCADARYDGKTMGVISLLGNRQQDLISKGLLEFLGPEEIDRRRLVCGGPYEFQGDERDVIFLSMVVAPTKDGKRPKPAQTSEEAKRRFNVSASRARDQLWLFHSVTLNDLRNPDDVRRKLLEYCLAPHVESIEFEFPEGVDTELVAPFESLFEQQVYLRIRQRGYRVLPQVKVGSYRIDLVVEGLRGRLAVECDGDQWHGPEQYEYDVGRQRQLERAGWTFWRIFGSDFYRNSEQALAGLWETLERLDIHPNIGSMTTSAPVIGEPIVTDGYFESFETLQTASSDVADEKDEPKYAFGEIIEAAEAYDGDSNGTLVNVDAEQRSSSAPLNLAEVQPIEEQSKPTHTPEIRIVSESPVQLPIEEIISVPAHTRIEFAIDELLTLQETKHTLRPTVQETEHTALPSENFADMARTFMIPYQHWTSRALRDPHDRPSREVLEELIEIIDAEGPVLVQRVYKLYAKAVGIESERQIRSALNSVLHFGYTQRRIEYVDEWEKPGQIDDIVRIPGRSRVRVREGGGRSIDELPPSEIAQLVSLVAEESGIFERQETPAIFEGILAAYGIDVGPSDLRRASLWEVVKKGAKRR